MLPTKSFASSSVKCSDVIIIYTIREGSKMNIRRARGEKKRRVILTHCAFCRRIHSFSFNFKGFDMLLLHAQKNQLYQRRSRSALMIIIFAVLICRQFLEFSPEHEHTVTRYRTRPVATEVTPPQQAKLPWCTCILFVALGRSSVAA